MSKGKKNTLIWTGIVILITIFYLVIYGYTIGFTGNDHVANDVELVEKIKEIAEEKRGNEATVYIDFNEVTSFHWDRLYIITPYTPTEEINKALGFKWLKSESAKGQLSISYSDHHHVLIFVADEQVVSYVEYPRSLGDFPYQTLHVLTPNEARFEIVEKEQWLKFVPQF